MGCIRNLNSSNNWICIENKVNHDSYLHNFPLGRNLRLESQDKQPG